MLDTKAIAAALAPIVKSHVAEATAPLIARIAELEKRRPQQGEPGRDGKDGADGRDADPVSEEQIASAVERYLVANPPAAGKDGSDGRDGTDGVGADMEALKAHCESLIAALPKPQDGKDGLDGLNGKDGEPGERGADGEDGRDGADGIGLAGAMIDRNGELNVTLTNGEVRKLGPVIGRDGRDGVDGERGEAGFSLTDFDTDWKPEEKALVLRWTAGETTYNHELFVPYVRDVGVWTEGRSYLQGDGVTWAGSFWIAQEDTADKPDIGKGWRLAVKRGRDGKDFAGPQPTTKAPVRI